MRSYYARYFCDTTLASLVAREDFTGKVILPIWHGVSKQEVMDQLPLLADKLAVTSDSGVEAVAQKILDVVGSNRLSEQAFERGTLCERLGQPDEAIAAYIEVLSIDKGHSSALRNLARLVNSAGVRRSAGKIHFGRVKWFSSTKGFGFIQAEDEQQYFVHISSLERDGVVLRAGDSVAFLVYAAGDKRIAASVQCLPSPP
ncbi:MAG: cold shock domain-containing protein [Gemmatimonas sp.]|nr:cold shock domain-containing protein [Gemmatimonas sp.]